MEKKMSKAMATVMAEDSVCEVFEVEYEDDHFTPCYIDTFETWEPNYKTSTTYFVSTKYMLEDLYDADETLSEMEKRGYDLEDLEELRKAIFTAWCEELDVPECELIAGWYDDVAKDMEVTINIADDPFEAIGSIAGEDIYTDGEAYWYPTNCLGYKRACECELMDEETDDGMPIYKVDDEYITATKRGDIVTVDSLEELGF